MNVRRFIPEYLKQPMRRVYHFLAYGRPTYIAPHYVAPSVPEASVISERIGNGMISGACSAIVQPDRE